MFDREHAKVRLKLTDVLIAAGWLSIFSSVLFIISNHNVREDLVEALSGDVEAALDQNRIDSRLISFIILVTSALFLYNSYINLQLSIDTYQKTGNSAGLEPSKLAFYSTLLLFAGSLINFYNTVANPGTPSDILL